MTLFVTQASCNDFVCYSGIFPDDKAVAGKLDPDGFPPVGAYLQEGDPFYW